MAKKRHRSGRARPPKGRPRAASGNRISEARQQANAKAGQKHAERDAERAAAKAADEKAAAERAAERDAERAAAERAAAERAALAAASPLPRGHKLPRGWLQHCPDLSSADTGDECAAERRRLLGWIAEGLASVHEADKTDPDEADHDVCWEGKVVQVHRRAVNAAAAVLDTANKHAHQSGLRVEASPRVDAGLADDSMRRVVVCVCDHVGCGTPAEANAILEACWPSTNAALEHTGGSYGYVNPAAVFSDEMRRRGFITGVGMNSPAWNMVAPAVATRLGFHGDLARDKPIYVQDIVYDSDGNLLAVRPRRPGPRARRPSATEAIEYLESCPDGVSLNDFAARFGVSTNTAKRVIDEINPELVYLGSPRRCVRRRGTHSRYVFAIISDRREIEARFRDYCRPGHEHDIEYVQHPPTGLIMRTNLVRVW